MFDSEAIDGNGSAEPDLDLLRQIVTRSIASSIVLSTG